MVDSHGRFLWYELMTTDIEAAKTFYAKVVGWGTRDASMTGMAYTLFTAGGTSVSGGKANVPGLWGGALFLVLLLTMLNTFGVSAGIRFVVTGLVIIGVIIAAGGQRAGR